MTELGAFESLPGTSAAQHLSPAYPERAPWGVAGKLRAWQQEGINHYLETHPKDFLVAATPGAGKTTFALRLAAILRSTGIIDRITIVAPTEHLKTQWADAAARAGIKINPRFSNADGATYGSQFVGAAVTYAQVAARPMLHRNITDAARTLVILDEVHHGGDTLSWGESMHTAFLGAERRLSLTGTPFRTDDAPIPFVTYARDGSGGLVSQTDFDFGYSRALADGIVRPVVFLVYSGEMKWQTTAGDVMQARLGEDNTKEITAQAWRTALDPSGAWISSVLSAAHTRLQVVRKTIPDAGGLVIATDQESARAYAAILATLTGSPITLVLSDDRDASARIDRFIHSTDDWMVAVRMVSEGVDVPRLAVGVYATSSSTPLFFAQAVGRFVRSRRRGEMASVFIPNVPTVMTLAAELERERDHVISVADTGEAWSEELAREDLNHEQVSDETAEVYQYAALASDAHFDRAIFEGERFGEYAAVHSAAELEFLGLPGVLDPEHVQLVLKQRQRRQLVHKHGGPSNERGAPEELPKPLHRTLKEQRTLLHSLVSIVARDQRVPHSHVHARLRRECGGPPVSQASVTQLQQRIEAIRREIR
jgi:superfamily II DNA or RNA helicase